MSDNIYMALKTLENFNIFLQGGKAMVYEVKMPIFGVNWSCEFRSRRWYCAIMESSFSR